MSSFQDQLLKAGVVDAKKVRKAKQDQHKTQKLQKQKKVVAADESPSAAAKAHAEKVAHDRKLNEERQAAAKAKAIQAQIKQLIELNKQPKSDADDAVGYNFSHGKKIKKVHVSPQTRDQLVSGMLAIVQLGEGYELVPMAIADKIEQRDQTAVVHRQETNSDADDDFYADYEIPDDLMW
ncbi:MAG: DUF2058 domain-containing protein [Woeseiaceae bacterium]